MRLIDAEILAFDIKVKRDWLDTSSVVGRGEYIALNKALVMIDEQPTIDAVEVVHGEWIAGREIGKEWNCEYWVTYYEDWKCSNCGIVFEQESKPKYHYCPNCGAKMDGEVKNDETN